MHQSLDVPTPGIERVEQDREFIVAAVCSKCGSWKGNPLGGCASCRWRPESYDELVLAYALSTECQRAEVLQQYQTSIQQKREIRIPSELMTRAASLVPVVLVPRDRKLTSSTPDNRRSVESGRAGTAGLRSDAPAKTSLELNAFAVLGATLRDSRQKLIELTEDGALSGDEEACQAAKAAVTNPRNRLHAEVAWLPGIAPGRISTLLAGLRAKPRLVLEAKGVAGLPFANLLAAALELADPNQSAEEWAEWILALAQAEDDIDVDDVQRDINEDRRVAGFAEIRDTVALEAALQERRAHYKNVVMGALERLPSETLVKAFTIAVTTATDNGERHAPLLIDEIGSAYDLQVTAAITQGAETITRMLAGVAAAGARGAVTVDSALDRLEPAVKSWDRIAQPVQLIMKSRGQEHEPSQQLAYQIRSTGIDLVNKHKLVEQGQRITNLLADVFAELSEFVERVGEDAETLQDMAEQQKQGEQKSAEWAREITYSAQIGAVFKDTLSISPKGVSWKSQSYPLDNITRVRWGAVRHSVNGIPTGTTYTMAFGDDRSQAVCETRQEEVFDQFVKRLFRAVGLPILVRMLAELGERRTIRVGDALVGDLGVAVPRHAFFGGEKSVTLKWHELHVWTGDGSFYIGSKLDKKAYAQLPYLQTDNAHLLERAIRLFFESNKGRLSQLFDD